MRNSSLRRTHERGAYARRVALVALCGVVVVAVSTFIFLETGSRLNAMDYTIGATSSDQTIKSRRAPAVLDTVAYAKKLEQVANNPVPAVSTSTATSTATSTIHHLWPAKAVYPNAGAILPFKRIIAYYGNFYSKGMGVLGEYPREEMLAKLKAEVARWEVADPSTPVVPAINYIDITAQELPGKDGKYRLRMPDNQIDYALELAKEVDGIVILDIQVGLSNLQNELPLLRKYLAMPQVHLAIDPEFSMKTGARPGTVMRRM